MRPASFFSAKAGPKEPGCLDSFVGQSNLWFWLATFVVFVDGFALTLDGTPRSFGITMFRPPYAGLVFFGRGVVAWAWGEPRGERCFWALRQADKPSELRGEASSGSTWENLASAKSIGGLN